MKTILKVEFNELQKSVSADVKLEVEVEDNVEVLHIHHDAILKEAQRLFDKAREYSHKKTLEKNL